MKKHITLSILFLSMLQNASSHAMMIKVAVTENHEEAILINADKDIKFYECKHKKGSKKANTSNLTTTEYLTVLNAINATYKAKKSLDNQWINAQPSYLRCYYGYYDHCYEHALKKHLMSPYKAAWQESSKGSLKKVSHDSKPQWENPWR